MVEYQLAATPLSTVGALTDESRRAVAHDIRVALGAYLGAGALSLPMQAHVGIARGRRAVPVFAGPFRNRQVHWT